MYVVHVRLVSGVYSHVSSESFWPIEDWPTCTTQVLFSPVCILMCFTRPFARVTLFSQVLQAYGFSCVHSHVYLQVSCLTEGRPTSTTCVWLVPWVYSHVSFAVSCLPKALPTRTTRIWLAGMGSITGDLLRLLLL